MDAKKCDRCGRYYTQYHTGYKDGANAIRLVRFDAGPNPTTTIINTYDLCPDCMKSIKDYIKYGQD